MEKIKYLNGNNIAKLSDLIFSENLDNSSFDKFNNKNIKILFRNETITSFKVRNFEINNGDIIFCNTAFLENLFFYLKKLKNVDHLILITSQSDFEIDYKLFRSKPECIKKWYAVNVAYEHEDLIPIPLGIANDYSPKNVRKKDLDKLISEEIKKENKLYINLRESTNFNERASIKSNLKNLDWTVYKEPNLSIEEYINDLKKYRFILCPWGNGIETHRLWETLYLGSIPVTKYHHTYKTLKNLPVIFVDNFENINLEDLEEKVSKLNIQNKKELNLEYWKELINSNIPSLDTKKEFIKENKFYEFYFIFKINFSRIIFSRLKIVKYYFKKISLKIN